MKSKLGRGGTRPGAGRPIGARNKVTQELKEMLGPLDEIGVERLEKIIRQGSDRAALEAVRLAWDFRHGRPKQQVERGDDWSLIDPNNVIVIGGNEAEYIGGMRRARGEDNPS